MNAEVLKEMDKECISLCKAINKIKGLQTASSCSGHNKNKFSIFLYARKVRNLYILARCIDRNYGGFSNWKLEVLDADRSYINKTPRDLDIIFQLHSGDLKGSVAYKQANIIASNILETLRNEAVMKMLIKK